MSSAAAEDYSDREAHFAPLPLPDFIFSGKKDLLTELRNFGWHFLLMLNQPLLCGIRIRAYPQQRSR